MNAHPLLLASALGLTAACGAGAGTGGPRAAAPERPAAVTPSTAEARPGLPTVPADDAVPPQLTTRTTVLENHRPALVVTLPDAVLFAFGSAELRPEAEPTLHALVDLLHQHPGSHAEVAGHTDAVGSAAYNQALSEQRAGVVVDWLAGHGVARTRLHAVGYGATRPVAGNAADEDRQRNRRVELTVTDN